MSTPKKSKKPEQRQDFRGKLTDKLIALLEEGEKLPFELPWEEAPMRPFNPGSGIKYKGGNVLNLTAEAIERGTDDPRWMTLKQANAAGYGIRKGAKAAYVEYWDWGQDKKPKAADENDAAIDSDDSTQERVKPRAFYAAVFNGQDIVGLPPLKRDFEWDSHELADKLIAATGAKISHTSVVDKGARTLKNRAYYSPGKDLIVMPPRERFKSQDAYYATVLHELAHWTGHSSRLDRTNMGMDSSNFSEEEYAREELRAEIASYHLKAMLGINGEAENHASYVQSWLMALKNDKHEIFRAARDAEHIVDHLLDMAPELREIADARLRANLLPKDAPKKQTQLVNADIPNFVPADAPVIVREGKEDPRWSGFEKTLRGQATRYGLGEESIVKTLSMIEPTFSAVMDAAAKKGFSADDMYTMLTNNIVQEMQAADERQANWNKFCHQVRTAAPESLPKENVDTVLSHLGKEYRELVARGNTEGWTKEHTDGEIRDLVFGEAGRRPVTPQFVEHLINMHMEKIRALENSDDMEIGLASTEEDEDDFVIQPIGISSDPLPPDLGVEEDEIISGAEGYLMDDAHIAP